MPPAPAPPRRPVPRPPSRAARAASTDMLALGEVMLRLDPGDARIRAARRFAVHEGGGEYNVARAAAAVHGLRAGVVTALVDDEVGRLVEDLVLASGVDTRWLRWERPGGPVPRRNGLNFTERGHGARGALGVSDRARTAVAALAPGDLPWEEVLGGTRWFHTGGVFAALSPTTTETAARAMRTARALGVPVSFDTNFRRSLWAVRGGQSAARATTRSLVSSCDVLIGSAWDLLPGTGGLPGEDRGAARAAFEAGVARIRAVAPGVRVIATTRRLVRSASRNAWGAFAWSRSDGVHAVPGHDDLEVLDRVGSGDAFAAGLVAGLLRGDRLPDALERAVATGALAMTTPGDAAHGPLPASAAVRPRKDPAA